MYTLPLPPPSPQLSAEKQRAKEEAIARQKADAERRAAEEETRHHKARADQSDRKLGSTLTKTKAEIEAAQAEIQRANQERNRAMSSLRDKDAELQRAKQEAEVGGGRGGAGENIQTGGNRHGCTQGSEHRS